LAISAAIRSTDVRGGIGRGEQPDHIGKLIAGQVSDTAGASGRNGVRSLVVTPEHGAPVSGDLRAAGARAPSDDQIDLSAYESCDEGPFPRNGTWSS